MQIMVLVAVLVATPQPYDGAGWEAGRIYGQEQMRQLECSNGIDLGLGCHSGNQPDATYIPDAGFGLDAEEVREPRHPGAFWIWADESEADESANDHPEIKLCSSRVPDGVATEAC